MTQVRKIYSIRSYLAMKALKTFEERLEYLMLEGNVGFETFGFDRYINQGFYNSSEWKSLRNEIIVRDNGCDLATEGYEINGPIYIHHMNPIDKNDIIESSDYLLNPDFLVCCSKSTHNMIHYGFKKDIDFYHSHERKVGDTTLWKNHI